MLIDSILTNRKVPVILMPCFRFIRERRKRTLFLITQFLTVGVASLVDTQPKNSELPPLKPADIQYFDKLLMDVDESLLSKEELIEREIMTYLLKIKNGTPPQRKSGLRKITENARRFGAGALFNQILPLLMSPTLEDQERHLMVKVSDVNEC